MPAKERVAEAFRILKGPFAAVAEEDVQRLQAILYVLALKVLGKEEMEKIKEEVNMSYLGQLIYNDGMRDGMEMGIEKGMEKSILTLILGYLADGISTDRILADVQKYFRLEEGKAKEYLEKCTAQ